MEAQVKNSPMNYFSQPGHFKSYSGRTKVFLEQLHFELDQLGPNPTVLDVGCGSGINLSQDPQFEIAQRSGTYWGVEPDPTAQSATCFDRVWNASLEEADIPESSVDFAYSQMVLEHVVDPAAFLSKLSKILKPGGRFLSLTVNSKSTFARISYFCHSLGIQDIVLTIARGKQLVEEYHYPAVYKMCSKPALERLARQAGLSQVDVTLLEADEWLVYFPRGTRWAGTVLTKLFQRRIANYSWLIARLQK